MASIAGIPNQNPLGRDRRLPPGINPLVVRGGLTTLIIGVVLAMPEGNLTNIPPEFVFVINMAKISAWCGIAYGLIRLARILNSYYQAFLQHIYEHRMVVQDLWERRPDKKDELETILAARIVAPVRAKSKGASAGGRF